MGVLLFLLYLAGCAGLCYGVIAFLQRQENGVTFKQSRQNRRQDKGKKILEDLLALTDLGDMSIQIPAPLLTRIDDWVNDRDVPRARNGWNRRYRQLAGILHDINHPSDVDAVSLVPPSMQSRIEAWLKAHLRAIGGI